MSTCNRLDLQTLGSQPIIMPKNLPDHWVNDMTNEQIRTPKHNHEGRIVILDNVNLKECQLLYTPPLKHILVLSDVT